MAEKKTKRSTPARSAARSSRSVAEAVQLLDPRVAARRGSRPPDGSRCRPRAAPGAGAGGRRAAPGRRARSARRRDGGRGRADRARGHARRARPSSSSGRSALPTVPVAPVSRITARTLPVARPAPHPARIVTFPIGAYEANCLECRSAPAAGPAGAHDLDSPTEATRRGRTPAVAYVIAEPCIGQKDNSCVEVCPGRLHPPDSRRARLRRRRAALHRPRRVHRLRRLRRGLPSGRLLRRGPAPRGVGQVHPDQRRVLRERVATRRDQLIAVASRSRFAST